MRIPFEIFELIFHFRFFQIHFRNEIILELQLRVRMQTDLAFTWHLLDRVAKLGLRCEFGNKNEHPRILVLCN